MPNLIPSDMLFSQVDAKLGELSAAVREGFVREPLDVISKMEELLTEYQRNAGGPLTDYELLVRSEPPSSAKTNRFWRYARYDIGVLKRQLDVLRAATILTYNITSTQVNEIKNNSARVSNKAISLQMYSQSRDAGLMLFSDSFNSPDFIDFKMTPEEERAFFANPGYITLRPQGEVVNLALESEVRIRSTSSDQGLLGNNQEILDPVSTDIDDTTGEKAIIFKQEQYETNDLTYLQDGEPDTWIEYEAYHIPQSTRTGDFFYKRLNDDLEDEDDTEQLHNWAEGPEGGILRLDLEFDLGAAKNLNSITLTPYGLENDSNFPILIRKVQTSPNNTDWTNVNPTDVWLTTNINLESARTASDLVANTAMWSFEVRSVRYVRVSIEQNQPLPTYIGQVYWTDQETGQVIGDEAPVPPIDDTGKYLDQESVNRMVQNRRYYRGLRWAIGIRDIELNQIKYQYHSTFVTRPMRVPGRISRVALESVELEIPEGYPVDQRWVYFYISPDDGENWYPIAQMQDAEEGIPQQISFNDPLHPSLRETYVVNYDTEKPVNQLRMKVEMWRPDEMASTTPVLKSYKLKVRQE